LEISVGKGEEKNFGRLAKEKYCKVFFPTLGLVSFIFGRPLA
jgi:hypothetical protein